MSYRYPDGSLQVLGTFNAGGMMGETVVHIAVRLDRYKEWLGQLLTSTNACGPVGADGICIGDVAVYCEQQRFSSVDCEAGGSQCFVDGDGLATCGCACDLEPFCEQECDCDPECQCSADCAAAGQECGLNTEGIAGCGCPCDLGPTCEAGCDCDMQCPCVCDQTATCDESCPCDPDCDSAEPPAESNGCAQAGGPRSLGSVVLPTLVILLTLGCGRLARRRRL